MNMEGSNFKKFLAFTMALVIAFGMAMGAFSEILNSSRADAGRGGPETLVSGYRESGILDIPKYTKEQIRDMLLNNPVTTPLDLFASMPTYTDPFDEGSLTDEALGAMHGRLNAMRAIAGVMPFEMDEKYNETSQHGAVLLAVSDCSGVQGKPANMSEDFFNVASEGAEYGNTVAGFEPVASIDSCIDDSASENISTLLSRRLYLAENIHNVGFGFANNPDSEKKTYMCSKIMDVMQEKAYERRYDYDFISWPASGNFPSDTSAFLNTSAWHVSLNSSLFMVNNKSDLCVTLRHSETGRMWFFKGECTPQANNNYFNYVSDEGSYWLEPTIIFRPANIKAYEGEYTVNISGIKNLKGHDVEFKYRVEFFNSSSYSQQTNYPAPDSGNMNISLRNCFIGLDGMADNVVDARYEMRSIGYQLIANGIEYGAAQYLSNPLTAANTEWDDQAMWINIPKFDADGKAIDYTLKVISDDERWLLTDCVLKPVSDGESHFELCHSLAMAGFNVEKLWLSAQGLPINAPSGANITAKLFRRDDDGDKFVSEVELNAENGFCAAFTTSAYTNNGTADTLIPKAFVRDSVGNIVFQNGEPLLNESAYYIVEEGFDPNIWRPEIPIGICAPGFYSEGNGGEFNIRFNNRAVDSNEIQSSLPPDAAATFGEHTAAPTSSIGAQTDPSATSTPKPLPTASQTHGAIVGPTATPRPSESAKPTATAGYTAAPLPTVTQHPSAKPTADPRPTSLPPATAGATATRPTVVPNPTATASPTPKPTPTQVYLTFGVLNRFVGMDNNIEWSNNSKYVMRRIGYQLFANGIAYGSIQNFTNPFGGNNSWDDQAKWTNVPKYDTNGRAISYKIRVISDDSRWLLSDVNLTATGTNNLRFEIYHRWAMARINLSLAWQSYDGKPVNPPANAQLKITLMKRVRGGQDQLVSILYLNEYNNFSGTFKSRAYTNDGSEDAFLPRIFLKDGNGNIIYQSGKPILDGHSYYLVEEWLNPDWWVAIYPNVILSSENYHWYNNGEFNVRIINRRVSRSALGLSGLDIICQTSTTQLEDMSIRRRELL